MAHIQKIVVVRWVMPVPGGKGKKKYKRATKSTPGAIPRKQETAAYYLFDEGRRIRELFTDKVASNNELMKYITAKERGESGVIDKFTENKNTPTGELVEKYLTEFMSNPGNDHYQDETARILRKAVGIIAPNRLEELHPQAIREYLSGLMKAATKTSPAEPCSPNTKKKHHGALSGFCVWLFETERMRENVILRVPIPKGTVQDKNKPRPLRLADLRRLFRTARTRPLNEALTIRRGSRKGQLVAQVGDEVRVTLERAGRERALVYRTAALTGLRRSELAKLRVRFLRKPKSLPFPIFDLPASITKNKRAARLWVLPNLAKRLLKWIRARGLGENDLIFTKVPSKKVFNRDRQVAGIPARTFHGKAEFRSLRSAGNRLLRQAKVPVNIRKLFMRHSDIRLTDTTYDDAILLSSKEVVTSLEKYRLA